MVKQCLRFLLVLCLLPASSLAQNAGAGSTQPAPAATAPADANQPVDANQADENQTDENQAAPAAPPATAPLPVKYSPEGFPILQDGTPVRLRLTRTLSSADCKAGDRIDFEVEEPVVLDGVTVIPQGSIAWGTVTEAEHKRRMTRGGKLAIALTEVQLANLQKAKLRATRDAKGGGHTGVMAGAMVGTAVVFWPVAPVFLLMHGKEAKIPEGTEVTAYVDGDTVFASASWRRTARRRAGSAADRSGTAGTGIAYRWSATVGTSTATGQPPAAKNRSGAESGTIVATGSATAAADAANAELTLTSTPDGADVEIDGAFVGSTPSTIPIASGDHTVRVSKKRLSALRTPPARQWRLDQRTRRSGSGWNRNRTIALPSAKKTGSRSFPFVIHANALFARDGHALDAQRGAGRGAAPDEVAADLGQVAEHLAQVAGHGDLLHRVGQLAVFNPDAAGAAREISGHKVDAEAQELGHQQPLLHARG